MAFAAKKKPTQPAKRSSSPPAPAGRGGARTVLFALGIILLGGGLGTGGYILVNGEMPRADHIALPRDAMDPRERLRMEIPASTKAVPPPPVKGNLLAPPPPGIAASKGAEGTPPSPPPSPPSSPPPKEDPPKVQPPPPPPPPPPPVTTIGPETPSPRPAGQPPGYEALVSRLASPKPLLPAPVADLQRQESVGFLPIPAADGRMPWRVYARPFDPPPGSRKPRVGVVVAGLGLDKLATETAIAKLPAEVTLAFSPYAPGLEIWVKKARESGHEVLISLPAETASYPARDPASLGLLVDNTPEENLSKVKQILSRSTGYVGVWLPAGPFTQSTQLAPVLAFLKEHGLLYLGQGIAQGPLPPMTTNVTEIPGNLFREAITAHLNHFSGAAKSKGDGVVVLAPRPVVFEQLGPWFDKLTAEGILLVPVSATVKQSG